jgi:putative hemolysin
VRLRSKESAYVSSERSSAIPLVTPQRSPLDELFNTATHSAGFKLIQRCLGVAELQCLYETIKGGQREGEYFLDATLRTLQVSWDISSLDVARIPAQGGLLVVANHPYGLIEGVVIAALLRRIRPDVRVMANSLLGIFPELAESLILVDPFGGELANRANRPGLRYALGWLKQGSVLIAFPAGEVASMQVRTMQVVDPPWSKSVARLASLARVPVLPVYFDGCNGAPFQIAGLLHPRLRTALLIREFLNKSGRSFSVRVGSLISPRRLEELHIDSERIEYLRRKTYVLANREEPKKPIPFLVPLKALRHRSQPNEAICPPTDAVVMEQEIKAVDDSACLVQQGDNSVYIVEANRLPNVVREIGRLREVTFRETGEGTGRAIDLDRFDSYYRHLFVWNHTNREIVGAYRLGQSDLILKNFGQNGFYTTTLFSYKRKFLDEITPALEMGRSFVRPEYQKSYAPLLLLWRGIGAYVCRNPQYKTLFGPVSISNQYHPRSEANHCNLSQRVLPGP